MDAADETDNQTHKHQRIKNMSVPTTIVICGTKLEAWV
jgi:hypothetical protein